MSEYIEQEDYWKDKAFSDAINQGILSINPKRRTYFANYLHLDTNTEEHTFMHKFNNKYIVVPRTEYYYEFA